MAAGIRGLLASLLITTIFASPHPKLIARQATCATLTCAASDRPEIREGAACLCSARSTFRASVCSGHPPLTSVFTTALVTRTSTTTVITTRPATTEYTPPPFVKTSSRTISADITATVTKNVTSVDGTSTTTVAYSTETTFLTITESTCANAPGSTNGSPTPGTASPTTTTPPLLRRQGSSTSFDCAPSSAWYSGYSAEFGAAAIRSACSCVGGGNEATRTTIVTRTSTSFISTQTRRSTVRGGTLTTRSTTTTTRLATIGLTVTSTKTSITTAPVIVPVTGTTTVTSTVTTRLPVAAPSSFRLYYQRSGGRQFAVSAPRPGDAPGDQGTRFLAFAANGGDTFTLTNDGRLVDTQGANAIAVATEVAPFRYLYLDRNINARGPFVPTCTWCNGPLSCDYDAAPSNNSAGDPGNTTNFYNCGGFLVLDAANPWTDTTDRSACARIRVFLEPVTTGGRAATNSPTDNTPGATITASLPTDATEPPANPTSTEDVASPPVTKRYGLWEM